MTFHFKDMVDHVTFEEEAGAIYEDLQAGGTATKDEWVQLIANFGRRREARAFREAERFQHDAGVPDWILEQGCLIADWRRHSMEWLTERANAIEQEIQGD